jgi:C4-dicarboxylate-specific signal transduction histidine kinase
VKLDGVALDAPDPGPFVEVFRVDLVLVLKNVLRNAVLAVGRAEAPRRVAIEVRVELLPTGEENVALRVLDSSPEVLTTEAIAERRVDRGLGLVTAALTRYDGAILVEDASPPYRKAVCVRFFRAFGASPEPERGADS